MSRYIETGEQISSRELRRGIWFVKHKLLFRKMFITILSLWSVITVGLGLIVWGKYIAIDYWDERDEMRARIASFPQYAAVHPVYEAKALVIGTPRVFQSAAQQYDFVTSVQNPNADMIARVTYHYVFASGETVQGNTFILPGRESHLAILGSAQEAFPARAQLSVDAITWERIDHHSIPDPIAYAEQRIQFVPGDLTYVEDGAIDALVGATLSFDLTNNSVYSYWEGRFMVELFRGSQPVGVVHVSVAPFMAGETQSIEQRLYQPVQGISRISVHPIIDVFDPSVYLPLDAT